MKLGHPVIDTTPETEKRARLPPFKLSAASLALFGILGAGAMNAAYATIIGVPNNTNLGSYSPPAAGDTWNLQGNASLSGGNVSLPTGEGLAINGTQSGSVITLNNGSGSYGFFTGNGATLSLSNLTLTGGNQTGGGTAIYDSGNLTLNTSGKVVFSGNTSNQDNGGAINVGGSVTLGNSGGEVTFSNNKATQQSGGAIFAKKNVSLAGDVINLTGNTAGSMGGAIFAVGSVTLGNGGSMVTLSNNQATFNSGGSLHADQNVTVQGHLTATGNSAGGTGGAIDANGSVKVNGNLTASGNTSGGDGGVIRAGTDLAVTGDAISLIGNTAGNGGGAIKADGNATLGNAASTVTLTNNTATTGGGGAIGVLQNLTVNGDLSASGNTAGADGGAIHVGGDLAATGALISLTGNTATEDGGAINAVGNVALGNAGSTVTLSNNTATTGAGGAIVAQGSELEIYGSSISLTGNTAASEGGAISAWHSVALGNAGSTVTLSNNTATTYSGGAIHAVDNVMLTGSVTASDNRAGGSGGAIDATKGSVEVNGALTASGNTAGGNGGAISSGGDITLTSATISNNIAAGSGGALWSSGNITLHAINGGITFSGNQQGSGANAIWMDNANSASGTPSMLTLNAAGNPITFYDPVQNNATSGLVSVLATGGNTVAFDGSQYSSATDRWSQLFANTEVQSGTTLAVQNNAVYGVLGADVNQAEQSSFTVDSGATLAGGTLGTVRADNFTLGGTLNIAGAAMAGSASGGYSTFNIASNNLTLGTGSQVLFNTYLNDASTQLTDLLTLNLNEGSSSGTSAVQVNNTGGAGGLTQGDGIKLIQVTGVSGASFALAAPVQAGAYEYQLFKGSDNGYGENWYLRSSIPSTGPTDPTDPGAPTDPEVPDKPAKPGTPIYRPATANYVAAQTANMEQGMTLLSTLHQRIGGTYDLKSDERQGWSRLYGDNQRSDGDRFNFKQNIVGIQFGHDLWVEGDGQGNTKRAGVVIDYARGNADFADDKRTAAGFGRNHTGRMDSDTLSIGGYGTFSKDDGSYLDSVVMISHIRNAFDDLYDDHATQKAWRLGLSAEVGKPVARIAEDWQVEPQAQLSYQRTWYDSFHDDVGKVGSYQADSLRGRVGVRVFNDTVRPQSKAQVYAIANVIQDFLEPESVRVGNTKLHENYDKTFGELGVGGRFNATENITLFGDGRFRQSFGGHAQGATVNVGIQVKF